MPSKASPAFGDRQRPPFCIVQQSAWEHARALAKSPVTFLKRNDIRIDFTKNSNNSVRITARIQTDRFMDIVAGELELHAVRYSPAIYRSVARIGRPSMLMFRLACLATHSSGSAWR